MLEMLKQKTCKNNVKIKTYIYIGLAGYGEKKNITAKRLPTITRWTPNSYKIHTLQTDHCAAIDASIAFCFSSSHNI